ncbi:MAG: hypothetical protein AB1567_06025 [bacterium]
MNLIQILFGIYFAILGTCLLIVLTREVRQNDRRLDKDLKRIDRGFELIAKLIVEENDRTRKQIIDALGE